MTRWAWIGYLLVFGACDLFGARTPEDPEGEAGTWQQPVAPDIVIENLRAAITELNTSNYRRSLHENFEFVPSSDAYARDPDQWINWDRARENGFFVTLAEASKGSTGNGLRLENMTTELGESEYILDASYILIISHGSQQVADTLQGRLAWLIIQESNGLWALTMWNDQSIGSEDSWSDLKAEFAS